MTTQGRFSAATILTARDVLPEPLEPAMPMILRGSALAKGGSYGVDNLSHGYLPMAGCIGRRGLEERAWRLRGG